MKKTICVDVINNEDGFLLIMSLMMLTILTIIGVSTSNTTRFELMIAANERVSSLSFYAAESARVTVEVNPSYFGSDYIIEGEGLVFPDETPYPDNLISSPQSLGADQSYHGRVVYRGASSKSMRGTGFAVGTFTAHTYEMSCLGVEPGGSESQVDAGFFRIGF